MMIFTASQITKLVVQGFYVAVKRGKLSASLFFLRGSHFFQYMLCGLMQAYVYFQSSENFDWDNFASIFIAFMKAKLFLSLLFQRCFLNLILTRNARLFVLFQWLHMFPHKFERPQSFLSNVLIVPRRL